MKPLQLLALTATAFAFTACDKKPEGGGAVQPATPATPSTPAAAPAAPVSEADAIANFKKDVTTLTAQLEADKKSPDPDPAAGMAKMTATIAKFKAVKTDGLPADLKSTWGEFTGVLGELGDVFKGMPAAKPDKPEDALKALGELMPKMMALQAKIEPIAKKLEEVGKKYGIEGLDKLGPGGKDGQ